MDLIDKIKRILTENGLKSPSFDLHYDNQDNVIGHVVDEFNRTGSGDEEFAHVTDVEQAAALAHGTMLGRDTGRVLNRHLEPGERHDPGAKCNVSVVEGRALEAIVDGHGGKLLFDGLPRRPHERRRTREYDPHTR